VCVQTTCYRTPKVMLHISLNEAIDMWWSVGLIIAEWATEIPLYPGNMKYDVLRFIVKTQGQPADHVLDHWMTTGYSFHLRMGVVLEIEDSRGLHK
ncbi:Homeodomain-interacting protein kinase 1, partial [Nibea albiflora]